MSGLLGETKLAILRQLRSEPSHGYALADQLDLSHGYVYTHLGDLEEAGMIEIQAEDDGKKVYRLTKNGEYLVKAFDDA
jgi:DNA-binding PadR family transcriptional regulator